MIVSLGKVEGNVGRAKKRILMISEDADWFPLRSYMLRIHSYDVMTAMNAEEVGQGLRWMVRPVRTAPDGSVYTNYVTVVDFRCADWAIPLLQAAVPRASTLDLMPFVLVSETVAADSMAHQAHRLLTKGHTPADLREAVRLLSCRSRGPRSVVRASLGVGEAAAERKIA